MTAGRDKKRPPSRDRGMLPQSRSCLTVVHPPPSSRAKCANADHSTGREEEGGGAKEKEREQKKG